MWRIVACYINFKLYNVAEATGVTLELLERSNIEFPSHHARGGIIHILIIGSREIERKTCQSYSYKRLLKGIGLDYSIPVVDCTRRISKCHKEF